MIYPIQFVLVVVSTQGGRTLHTINNQHNLLIKQYHRGADLCAKDIYQNEVETLSGYYFWDLWTVTFGVLWLIRWGLLMWLLVDAGWRRTLRTPTVLVGIFYTLGLTLVPLALGIGELFTLPSQELAQPMSSDGLVILGFFYVIILAALIYNQIWWWPNWAMSYRGFALLTEQRHADAVVVYQRMVKRSPNIPLYWVNLASALYLLGRLPEAIGASDQAITRTWWRSLWRTNSWRAQGWMIRARILYSFRQPGPALDSNSQALHLRPGNFVLWERESLYLAQLGRYPEALDASVRALTLIPARARNAKYPFSGLALVTQAEALNGLYRSPEALAVADQAVSLTKYPVRAHLARAIALTQMGRQDEARAAAEQGLAAAERFFAAEHNIPGRAEMFGYQAYLLRLAGRMEEADTAQAQSAALYAQMATPLLQ